MFWGGVIQTLLRIVDILIFVNGKMFSTDTTLFGRKIDGQTYILLFLPNLN